MLSWFRKRSRAIGSTALVSLLALTISSAVPHADDCHGAECAVVALHDPSGHSIGRSEKPSDHPNHCVACHWTRSLRTAPETTHLLVPVVTQDVRIALDAFSVVSQTSLLQPSLRAPPVSPRLT